MSEADEAATRTSASGFLLPASASRVTEPAVVTAEGTLSWRALEEATRRLTHGLDRLGLRRGSRVAILGRNSLEWLVVYFGTLRAGSVFVPIHHGLLEDEIVHILTDSEAELLFVDPESEARGRTAASAAGVDEILCLGEGFHRWLGDQLSDPPDDRVAGTAMAYTSGTTGRPKGLTPPPQTKSVREAVADLRRLARIYGYREGGVHLVASTLDHGAPALHAMMAAVSSQRLVVMRRFDPARALDMIARHRVTTTHLVPTQIIRMLRLPADVRRAADTSSLQTVFHGASPCPEWAKRAAIAWLGPILVEYFGSKEGSGPFVCTSEEWLERPGTVGRAGAYIEVSVIGEDGEDLPPGEIGLLYFRRTDGRAPEYRGAPDKTAAARLPDGRFTVGDVGWLDDEGYLYLADRRSDLILTGGVNVYPAEVEAVLTRHPAVEDCAVYGVEDPEWGEAVQAAVVLRPEAEAGVDELLDWTRDRLAHYKCPRRIEIRSQLPRDAMGKLRRRFLVHGPSSTNARGPSDR